MEDDEEDDETSHSFFDAVKETLSEFIKAIITQKKSFLIASVVAISVQITGINAVNSYAPEIIQDTIGIEGKNGLLFTAGLGGWALLCIITPFIFVDRCGRKPLLIIGFVFMFTGMVVLALSQLITVLATPAKISMVFVGLALFLLGFQSGPGPMFYICTVEVFDVEVRGRAMALINGIQLLTNFFIVQFFPRLQVAMKHFVFIPLFVLAAFAAVFVFIFLPETKGKELNVAAGAEDRKREEGRSKKKKKKGGSDDDDSSSSNAESEEGDVTQSLLKKGDKDTKNNSNNNNLKGSLNGYDGSNSDDEENGEGENGSYSVNEEEIKN